MLTTQSHDKIVQIKKILQEDEERFDHYLGLLEKWMACHAFLPKDYDKRMLPIFLRNCKYNLDKTKHKLEMYFVYKKRYPKMFCFYEFNDAEKQGLKNYYTFEASRLTPEGYRVVYAGYHRSPDTTGCDMNVVNKIWAMHCTYRANLDEINCGLIIVFDLQNLSPSIVSGLVNPFFKRNVDMIYKAYPFRIGGIYITFVPEFAVPIANMVKIILDEKIRRKVHIEAENKEMKKKIPMYCLPKEYGGTDGTINENTEIFMQGMMQAKPWFQEQKKIQVVGDIPKDLHKFSTIDENFGPEGSFRKINID